MPNPENISVWPTELSHQCGRAYERKRREEKERRRESERE